MSRAKDRADRIRAEIPLVGVLASYGYRVQRYGEEQQFSCDLHGDGRDSKPSARVYPDTNTFYCWGCQRSRDAIELTKEKEGLDFSAACRALEERHGLPALPWSEDAEPDNTISVTSILNAAGSATFEKESTRFETFLKGLTDDRDLPLKAILVWWEAYDKLCYLQQQGTESLPGILQLKQKILTTIKEYHARNQTH